MFFVGIGWIYGNMFFAANHIFDKDLRWNAKSNFTAVEAPEGAGGDDEEDTTWWKKEW